MMQAATIGDIDIIKYLLSLNELSVNATNKVMISAYFQSLFDAATYSENGSSIER